MHGIFRSGEPLEFNPFIATFSSQKCERRKLRSLPRLCCENNLLVFQSHESIEDFSSMFCLEINVNTCGEIFQTGLWYFIAQHTENATDTYFVIEEVMMLKGGTENKDNKTTRLVVNSPSYSFGASAENGKYYL